MPRKLTSLRVFIASPSGLADERKAFRDEIQEFNDADAIARGVLFQPLGWEDTLGGIGRPQTIINEDVRSADYFVLLLWNRWGSPPDTVSSGFTSGTEEEYHVALECCTKHKTMRRIVIMFRSVDLQQLSDPGPQLERVLEFRRDIERRKEHLFHTFDTTENFRKLIHKHLAAWLRDDENGNAGQGPNVAPVVESGIRGHLDDNQQQLLQETHEKAAGAAWKLAEEGRLTEAEVEFARNIVGRHRPQPLIEYGQFLSRVGRLQQAAVMFEGAIAVAIDQGDQDAVARAYGNLGMVLRLRGDLDGAEQMFRKALEIDERLGLLEDMARQYGNLGVGLRLRGNLDGAEQMFLKALEIDERLGLLEGMADHYGSLGVVLLDRRDLGGSEQMFRKALEINEGLGRLEGMAKQYGNLGIVVLYRGDLDGAEQMQRKALEIDERLGRLAGMAKHYCNLGTVLHAAGDLDGAEQMQLKAVEINERLSILDAMAINCTNLAAVLQSKGNLDGAEQMFRKALEIDERLGRFERMAKHYCNLARVLHNRGDLDGAEQMQRKALEIYDRLGLLDGMAPKEIEQMNGASTVRDERTKLESLVDDKPPANPRQ